MNLNLTPAAGNGPAGIQWTFTYDPTRIASINAAAGPAALAASKTVQCAGGGGSYTCLITGMNQNPIGAGVVAVLTATLSSSAAGLISVGTANPVTASSAGASLAVNGTGGAISVVTPVSTAPNPPAPNPPASAPPPVNPPGANPPPVNSSGSPPTGNSGAGGPALTSLLCNPQALTAGDSAACTVSLDQPASSTGATIALFSSSTALKAPASANVTAGSSSVTFSVTAGTVTSNFSALLTALLNTSSQRLLLSLSAPVTPAPTPAPPQPSPTISGIPAGVVDAASYTSNVAQGAVFVVRGSYLCPDGTTQAATYPLTATLNGVSIAFTPATGGASASTYIMSTYGNNGTSQVAALLPSTVAPGTYKVTVTNGGVTSAPVSVNVVARKFRLFTADSSGSGAAALQTVDAGGAYHYNRFTTQTLSGNSISPAHAGDFVVAYGTGLGPIQIPDQSPPGVLDLNSQANIQVLIDGAAIAPLYAGRSPDYPGVDQINFQLPDGVATGCLATIQVSVDGKLSNAANISIGPAGSDVCSPAPVSRGLLSRLDQGGSLTMGNFWLTQLTPAPAQPLAGGIGNVNESAFGGFVKYSGSQLASAAAFLNPAGMCRASHIMGDSGQLVFGPVATHLDAGQLTLAGPGLASGKFTASGNGTYLLTLGSAGASNAPLYLPLGFPSFNTAPTLTAGAYQLTGSGGADVGNFSASLTIGQPVAIQGGLPLSIDRGSDLVLSWSGGNPGDVVSVTGISGTVIGGTAAAPLYDAGSLTCTAMASTGSITIPSALLMQLPPTPTQSGIGYLSVTSGPQPVSGDGLFTAPLKAGGALDSGFFLGALGTFGTANYR